jgi:hypothetical protein
VLARWNNARPASLPSSIDILQCIPSKVPHDHGGITLELGRAGKQDKTINHDYSRDEENYDLE